MSNNKEKQEAPEKVLQEFFFPSPVPMTIMAESLEEAEKIYKTKLNIK